MCLWQYRPLLGKKELKKWTAQRHWLYIDVSLNLNSAKVNTCCLSVGFLKTFQCWESALKFIIARTEIMNQSLIKRLSKRYTLTKVNYPFTFVLLHRTAFYASRLFLSKSIEHNFKFYLYNSQLDLGLENKIIHRREYIAVPNYSPPLARINPSTKFNKLTTKLRATSLYTPHG